MDFYLQGVPWTTTSPVVDDASFFVFEASFQLFDPDRNLINANTWNGFTEGTGTYHPEILAVLANTAEGNPGAANRMFFDSDVGHQWGYVVWTMTVTDTRDSTQWDAYYEANVPTPRTSPVPEPTVALLSTFGALLLLRRKR